MTLNEAIEHSLHKSKDLELCEECRKEHNQLYEWLCELKELRQKNTVSKEK